MAEKYVYFFGTKMSEGNAKMKDLLGGKGANLAEMANLGIPVPPGFTISTEAYKLYSANKGQLPESIKNEVIENMKKVEEIMGLKFGDAENPLLVSVRSGARSSMPGMMDTILNLGLNDATVQGLIKKSGNPRWAYDCYRRFVQMYGDIVIGLKPEGKEIDPFEALIENKKEERGVKLDIELTAQDLKDLVYQFKKLIKARKNVDFPEEPWEQLWGAISAVFSSWNNKRAIEYRRINKIPDDWGTAVNVQAMVFGNLGNNSATGVAFTRNPATGEKVFYGEYLLNAQGEDVVAGIRTPQPINKASKNDPTQVSLEEKMPQIYNQLLEIVNLLEKHYREMQDIEFTVQEGKLFLLQTRTGKRTAQAAVKIAVDMVKEGLISIEEAIQRIQPSQLDNLLHPMIDPQQKVEVIAKGLPASPGAATGKVVFNAADAVEESKKGEKVILVRIETSPEDISGMNVAQGILTARGGMTSHAAVVARGMGKCCVAGCGDININYQKEIFTVGKIVVKRGDIITLNGSTGEVILGEVKMIIPKLSGEFAELMEFVNKIKRLGVRTNADTPEDAEVARKFGAEGIGLCRTEHMFFKEDRILAMREMIVSDDIESRKKALSKILPMQKDDFKKIFQVMKNLPVTIRLLDPPLHEFLPNTEKEIKVLAKELEIEVEALVKKIQSLHEVNPMLGHRGCRLGITYPEITEMQTRAIIEAAAELIKEENINVEPEIMVPLVGTEKEFIAQKKIIVETAQKVMNEYQVKIKYKVGTMIEVPRAALVADKIAREADFFSFGTNDLTQMTFGYSRDDIGKFLPIYLNEDIISADPFANLDQEGVGQLIILGIEKGRKTKPNLKIGICGEHGGDPDSIKFCHQVGMDYVSCSPYRVPIARLTAAQAKIEEKK